MSFHPTHQKLTITRNVSRHCFSDPRKGFVLLSLLSTPPPPPPPPTPTPKFAKLCHLWSAWNLYCVQTLLFWHWSHNKEYCVQFVQDKTFLQELVDMQGWWVGGAEEKFQGPLNFWLVECNRFWLECNRAALIFDIRELSNAAVAVVGVLKVRHQDCPDQGFGYRDDEVVLPISFHLCIFGGRVWHGIFPWQYYQTQKLNKFINPQLLVMVQLKTSRQCCCGMEWHMGAIKRRFLSHLSTSTRPFVTFLTPF